VAGLPAHPEGHVGEHGDRDEADDRLHHLLRPVIELARGESEGHPDHRAEEDPPRDAYPHRGQQVLTSRLHEICADDADDQRGLEPLPDHDEQRCQHLLIPLVPVRPHHRGTPVSGAGERSIGKGDAPATALAYTLIFLLSTTC
jgi:hypothetical protein